MQFIRVAKRNLRLCHGQFILNFKNYLVLLIWSHGVFSKNLDLFKDSVTIF